jgi:hypothetical protein
MGEGDGSLLLASLGLRFQLPIPLLSPLSLWCAERKIYLYLYLNSYTFQPLDTILGQVKPKYTLSSQFFSK